MCVCVCAQGFFSAMPRAIAARLRAAPIIPTLHGTWVKPTEALVVAQLPPMQSSTRGALHTPSALASSPFTPAAAAATTAAGATTAAAAAGGDQGEGSRAAGGGDEVHGVLAELLR